MGTNYTKCTANSKFKDFSRFLEKKPHFSRNSRPRTKNPKTEGIAGFLGGVRTLNSQLTSVFTTASFDALAVVLLLSRGGAAVSDF